ncbi:MAG: hypothetical protein C4525_01955 [Desulfarculus sp.]|jgi:hypothetical protein|nr:MAG: hypothetical protein C4525_01955 [Desulfarculus sp.]
MTKKLWGLSLAALLLLSAAPSALAGEMGGAASFVPKGMYRVSIQAGYVNEQKMKDIGGEASSASFASPQQDIKIKEDKHFGAVITYGLHERINVFAELGLVSDGRLSGDRTVPGTSAKQNLEATLKDALAWAVGIKGQLWEHKKGFGVMASARYFRYDDRKVDDWTGTGAGADIKGLGSDTSLDYWQFDLAVAAYWRFKRVTPYLGAKYSYAEGRLSGSWNLGSARGNIDDKYEPESPLGLFAGVDLRLFKRFHLNLQANFYDQTAFWVSGNYDF